MQAMQANIFGELTDVTPAARPAKPVKPARPAAEPLTLFALEGDQFAGQTVALGHGWDMAIAAPGTEVRSNVTAI